jgi:hypothetical protein
MLDDGLVKITRTLLFLIEQSLYLRDFIEAQRGLLYFRLSLFAWFWAFFSLNRFYPSLRTRKALDYNTLCN